VGDRFAPVTFRSAHCALVDVYILIAEHVTGDACWLSFEEGSSSFTSPCIPGNVNVSLLDKMVDFLGWSHVRQRWLFLSAHLWNRVSSLRKLWSFRTLMQKRRLSQRVGQVLYLNFVNLFHKRRFQARTIIIVNHWGHQLFGLLHSPSTLQHLRLFFFMLFPQLGPHIFNHLARLHISIPIFTIQPRYFQHMPRTVQIIGNPFPGRLQSHHLLCLTFGFNFAPLFQLLILLLELCDVSLVHFV
jgi:hypothetical protein